MMAEKHLFEGGTTVFACGCASGPSLGVRVSAWAAVGIELQLFFLLYDFIHRCVDPSHSPPDVCEMK